MAKIMLVEDDNSLREIYEARLAAEGYTVVTAKDGEEALALALKERPDLIIADVMMPKVSGFDMLDILRSTPETKNTKIIMMTALSQAEDKARAEKLGADRYLVKSQVTLEDVTREAHTILGELENQAAATVAKVEAPAAPSPATPKPQPAPAPATEPAPVAKPPTPPAAPKPAAPASTSPTVTSIPVSAPDDTGTSQDNDTQTKTDDKLEKTAEELSTPIKTEEAEVKEQVDEFIASNPTLSDSPEPFAVEEKSPEEATAAVNDAVDSLTKSSEANPENGSGDKKSGRNLTMPEESGSPSNEALKHAKVITPTPEAERASTKPDLNALLAKESGGASNNAPQVNSVIAPNDTGGAPPAN